jgi:hypothetical protein
MPAKSIYITPEEYAIAEKNGIPAKRVYNRVNNSNWSVERAVTDPIQKQYKMEYEKYKVLCDKNNVSYQVFRKRMKRKGMTGFKAASIAVTPPKITAEHRALADKNGIPKTTI